MAQALSRFLGAANAPSQIRFLSSINSLSLHSHHPSYENYSSMSYIKGPSSPPLLPHTVSQLLRAAADAHGDREALVAVHQHIRWSYRELDERVDRLAMGLLDAGLRCGDPVGICSANNAEWLE